jgi:ferredoxin
MSGNKTDFVVQVMPKGWRFQAPRDVSLLAAARAAGIDLPASCRNGTCRTCLCKLSSGRVRYSIEWPGLSRDEKAEGYILPCVAHAESDVVIEVRHARELPKQVDR